jgi:hypothetical protein
MMDTEMEKRIRAWLADNRNAIRSQGRETAYDWLAALIAEIDELRKPK